MGIPSDRRRSNRSVNMEQIAFDSPAPCVFLTLESASAERTLAITIPRHLGFFRPRTFARVPTRSGTRLMTLAGTRTPRSASESLPWVTKPQIHPDERIFGTYSRSVAISHGSRYSEIRVEHRAKLREV